MQVHGNPLRGLWHGWKRNPPRLQRLCNIIICDDKVISSKPNNLPAAACGVFCDFFFFFLPLHSAPSHCVSCRCTRSWRTTRWSRCPTRRRSKLTEPSHAAPCSSTRRPASERSRWRWWGGALSHWPTGACVCSSSIRRFNKTVFVRGGRAGRLVGAEERGNK